MLCLLSGSEEDVPAGPPPPPPLPPGVTEEDVELFKSAQEKALEVARSRLAALCASVSSQID